MNAQESSTRSIELSLLPACPVRCDYCPQDVLQKAHRRTQQDRRPMTADTAVRCVRNASRASGRMIPVDVHFAGFTEPLMSPEFNLIFEAMEAESYVRHIVLYSTGNGVANDKLCLFRDSKKLNLIDWHIRPEEEGVNGYLWRMIRNGDLDDRVVKCRQRATLVRYNTDRFDRRKIAASLPFELRYLPVVSRSNNVVHLKGPKTKQAVTCGHVTDSPRPVILPSGDACACCNDYGHELIIGNLVHGGWQELNFDRVRKMQGDAYCDAPCFRNCHLARVK